MTYSKIIHSSAPPGDTSFTIGVIVWSVKCWMLTCTEKRIETVETLYFEKKILTYSLLRHPSSFNNSKPPLPSAWDGLERRGQDESQTVGCHKTVLTIESETKLRHQEKIIQTLNFPHFVSFKLKRNSKVFIEARPEDWREAVTVAVTWHSQHRRQGHGLIQKLGRLSTANTGIFYFVELSVSVIKWTA